MKTQLALIVVLAAACSKDNPYYCESNPDHNCTVDSGNGDTPLVCTSADDCTDKDFPACDTAAGQCAACTPSDIGTCKDATPVCSSSNTCRACAANSECISGACMPDGSCAAPDKLLYVSPSGGATTCAATDKCSFEQAVAIGDKKTLVLDAGTYTTNGTVSTNKEMTILGRDAIITKGGSGNAVLNITSGGKVTIYYATIKNGNDNGLGHGIACTGATVVAQFVALKDNAANGLNASSCDVTIERSTVSGNMAGGILLSGTNQPFTITNNFIYLNGSPTIALVGGVKMGLSTPTNSRIEFNTIIDNTGKIGTGNTGGMACSVAFSAPNNILARNVLGTSTTATDANHFGDCSFPTSLEQTDLTGIAFASTTTLPYDLHIASTSTARDMATTTSTVVVDFEGDSRLLDTHKDIGADEFK